jgi:hypothetical protein
VKTGEKRIGRTKPLLRNLKAELVKRRVLPQPAYALFTPCVIVHLTGVDG